jgi:hypothetical protein
MGTSTVAHGITTYGTINGTIQACITRRSLHSDWKCKQGYTCFESKCLSYARTWAQYSDNNYASEDQATFGVGCAGGAQRNRYDNRSFRCDQSLLMRNYTKFFYEDGSTKWNRYSTLVAIKANAITPTVGQPSTSNITAFTVDVGGSINLGTFETTANAYLQYKRAVDSTWSEASGAILTGTGESSQSVATTQITGLTPETTYHLRFRLNRDNTTNTTKNFYSSAWRGFTTLPDVPEATTVAASSVSGGEWNVSNDGSANLNGIADRNSKTSCRWRFVWGTAPATYSDSSSYQLLTTEPETVQYQLTNLAETDTYYFRLELRYDLNEGSGEPPIYAFVYGSELSFEVPASPQEEAAKEAQMFVYNYDAIQGEDKAIYFSYRDVSTSDSDRFLTNDVSGGGSPLHPAANGGADVQIYIDGVVKSTNSGQPDNNITRIGSTSVYTLTLDGGTELLGEDVMVQFVDTGGPVFRDFSVHVRTQMKTSTFTVDSSQGSGFTNQSGLTVKGKGNKHGLEAIGGATGWDIYGASATQSLYHGTLDTNAQSQQATLKDLSIHSASDDHYNGGILLVTAAAVSNAAGQSREIIDYDASSRILYLSTPWVNQPADGDEIVILVGPQTMLGAIGTTDADCELGGVPTAKSTWGEKLQFLYQRFAYKIEQTATEQIWFKAGGADTLGTRTVDDDGNKQQIGQLSA